MIQLYTRWGEQLDKEHILEEYPRPQMVRDNYRILNGSWEYCFSSEKTHPLAWEGVIIVPFSPEAVLSGVNRQLLPSEYLWYRKNIILSPRTGMRTLLHFGAVDQTCEVWINGTSADRHHGGYLSFSLDITELVIEGVNEIVLCVRDVSDTSYHARGKQKIQAGGMFYTAQSGIWQTVWMEEVPEKSIQGIRILPNLDKKSVFLEVQADGNEMIDITVYQADLSHQENADTKYKRDILIRKNGVTNKIVEIPISNVMVWTPEIPYLYSVQIEMGQDRVQSYFAMRLFSVEKDENEIPRICLNHESYFQKGVLDQGYWPDGLYTAPDDEALVFDIMEMKKSGFNMMRKHIKIESERWYYHCDRLGMIVWQDMVSGGEAYHHWYVTYYATVLDRMKIKGKDTHLKWMGRQNTGGQKEFEYEMIQTIRQLYSHPCIAAWVIFNEGWGQFATKQMYQTLMQEDDSRLVDAASGWFDQGIGDIKSLHNYFFPFGMKVESERAIAVSEFGGFSLPVKGHSSREKVYGYGMCRNAEKLMEKYNKKQKELESYYEQGLCASVYTQVSDVEEEVNGILTFDRKIKKIECM